MSVHFRVNQIVWVKDGDKNEELGVIVKLLDSDVTSGNDNEHSNEVEVLFPVTGKRHIFPRSFLRSADDEKDEVDEKRKRHPRRTTRSLPETKNSSPSVNTSSEVDNSSEPISDAKQVVKKEDDQKPTKSKRASRGVVVTPTLVTSSSPHFTVKKIEKACSSTSSTNDEKTKKLTKNGKSLNAAKKQPEREVSEDSDSVPPTKKIQKKGASVRLALIERDDSSIDDAVNESVEDPSDRPFKVELSPNSRATCRTCDQLISNNTLRVSHIPLFRGKPGYLVYRHLDCAVFSEEIQNVEDVGGWSKLNQENRKALKLRIEKSKILVAKESEEIEPDELVQTEFQGEIRQAPRGLAGASMLPFQVEGASWMYHQEYNVEEIRGGILADEMGMGKTLQTIVTMLDNRSLLQHSKPGAKHPPSSTDLKERVREEKLWHKAYEEWKFEMEMNNVPKSLMKQKTAIRAGTLVVCPLIALSQWKSEIEKFTEPSTFSIGIYHGANRDTANPLELLSKYDVVLTTFQVLEQDFRKMVSPNKISCPNCRAKFKIDKLRVHLKYFCGEGAQRTEAQSRQVRASERDDDLGADSTSKKRKGKGASSKMQQQKKKSFTKRSDDVTSESDLSEVEYVMSSPTTCRPCRPSAQSAAKKVTSAIKEMNKAARRKKGAKDSDEDSDSSYGSESDEDSAADSDESTDVMLSSLKGGGAKQVGKKSQSQGGSALERARKKQQLAMESVKKKQPGKKVLTGKKGPPAGKKGKQGPSDHSDPLDGVDLDGLMEEAMAGSKRSPLHAVCWWRVVLDEAHFIKSRSSQTAAAAFALTSIHRWCLSGTPLQNRVGELYSLIRFLRIDPMAYYFCRQKGCTCKCIHYRMQHGVCLDCNHRSFVHHAHFNKYVLTPIQRDGYSGDGRRAMFTLKNEVLDKCLLRRTKETRAADMELPPRLVTIRSIRLHPVEEDFYQSLYMETKASFDDYVQAGTLMNNYAHIFDLLTKMRQATNHPYMVVYTKKNAIKMQEQQGCLIANGSTVCDMCHETPTDRILSSCCGTAFCRSCVIEYLTGAGGGSTSCPSCRSPFTIDLNQEPTEDLVDDDKLVFSSPGAASSSNSMPSLKELPNVATGSILRRINLSEFATSTKIEVLIQELIEMRRKRPGSKALVFSQFVNMLDLVRWRLHSDPYLADLGLGVRILHGGMDAKSRDLALKVFREDNTCRVLLMSLKAAGVALNLTVASECFLLDLWWNPAAEMQAIDRTHRLGQYRPIRAVRFVAEGTVEERVLQLQEKKRLVFDGTVGRDAGSLKMLTVDDMKALFA